MNKYLQKVIKWRTNYKFNRMKTVDVGKQCCPNYEDIDSAREIGKQLRSNNLIDFVSNILEWEDRNIQYWYERSDLDILRSATIEIFAGLSILVIVAAMIYQLLYTSLVAGYVYYLFDVMLTLLIVSFFTILIGSLEIKCYQYLRNDHFISKNNIDEKSVKRRINSIQCSQCMSVEEILTYKGAVCRDYTKLSCAILLTSLLFDDFIYIITIPNHSACAIKHKTTYYVIDQHLPLKQIDMWLTNKKEEKANLYKININRSHNQIFIEPPVSYTLSSDLKLRISEINISFIERELSGIYHNVPDSKTGNKIILKINKYFDDICKFTYYDDVTHNSFVYLLKKKIDDSLCNNVSHINSIKILPDDRYIVLQLYAHTT